jgi:hypothetical protein
MFIIDLAILDTTVLSWYALCETLLLNNIGAQDIAGCLPDLHLVKLMSFKAAETGAVVANWRCSAYGGVRW